MEIGIYTFAETSFDPTTGRQLDVGRRLQDLLEEIELADEVGLDVFGVGEHHRPDYAVSTPAVILSAAAARTKRIRLTSAVSVLSSDDPVRVFQDFATLDQISGGRAEIMVGRGSFTESFPLFGQDLSDYDDLFSEKLDLLLRLREEERISWSGHHRRRGSTFQARGGPLPRDRGPSRPRSGDASHKYQLPRIPRRRPRGGRGARVPPVCGDGDTDWARARLAAHEPKSIRCRNHPPGGDLRRESARGYR